MIEKAEKALLTERIKTINKKIDEYRKRSAVINQQLDDTVSVNVKSHVSSHITKVRKREYSQTKARHIKKLDQLNVVQDMDLSGEQLKKWIVNTCIKAQVKGERKKVFE